MLYLRYLGFALISRLALGSALKARQDEYAAFNFLVFI